MTPALMTVPDACRALCIHRATLYRWAKAGRITVARLGGRTRVRVDEVARFIAECEDRQNG